MDKELGLIFGGVFTFLGCILLFGAYKKWEFLVDPPEEYWKFYSQSFIKKIFGKQFLLIETYLLGLVILLLGIRSFFLY